MWGAQKECEKPRKPQEEKSRATDPENRAEELDCEARARDPEPSRRRLGQTLKKDQSEPKE